jgi:glyoxylase-like metal-dependent hydrolase (beta-lactamase superfamily II)
VSSLDQADRPPSTAGDLALAYPIERAPEPGEAIEIAPGVHWARLPLAGALRHINVWLLEDGDGWTLVDTGLNAPEPRAAWEGPLHDYLRGRPLHRIICTHHHPDHAGLATWLQQRHGCAIWMTSAEEDVMRRLERTWHDDACREARLASYAAEGLQVTPELRQFMVVETYRRAMSGIPERIARHVADGEILEIGAYRWKARILRGHTDGQLVLVAEDAALMIAGDQILPRITSNIGIYPERADQDPVASYIESFDALDAVAANRELLVLPSHGNVFRGLDLRLEQLRRHHAETLDRLLGIMDAPATASQLAQRMFRAQLDALNTVLAHGETLAHVRYLVNRGLAAVVAGDGPRRYVRAA